MRDKLQQAADVVRAYAANGGLECASQKTELLLVQNRPRLKNDNKTTIETELDGVLIKPSSSIKILGMILQEDSSNTQAIRKLNSSISQIPRMRRCITNKKHGMKEQDTIRLVQAFVVSTIV